jgi:hypothetical protein
MEKNVSSAKEKGTIAGAICFAGFMVPWLFFAFCSYMYSEGFILSFTSFEKIEIGIFIVASVFVGFSFSRNSKILKVISVLLAASVFLTFIAHIFFD